MEDLVSERVRQKQPQETEEQVLQGGIANAGAVVRSGTDVLRPTNPHSASIHALLAAVRARGFTSASEPVSIDADGRERLHFVPGDVPLPPYRSWAQSDESLASIAVLIRRFHDASIDLVLDGATWSREMADPLGGPSDGCGSCATATDAMPTVVQPEWTVAGPSPSFRSAWR